LITPNASEPERSTVKWQIPVNIIKDSMDNIGGFPYTAESGEKWNGRTLVVKGAQSKCV
jgi:hypothetical protein